MSRSVRRVHPWHTAFGDEDNPSAALGGTGERDLVDPQGATPAAGRGVDLPHPPHIGIRF